MKLLYRVIFFCLIGFMRALICIESFIFFWDFNKDTIVISCDDLSEF